jgi:hypothetical protein
MDLPIESRHLADVLLFDKHGYSLEDRHTSVIKREKPQNALSDEDKKLIHRIRQKVADGNAITYMQEFHNAQAQLYPPITESELRDAETQIGFRLPALIRELYLQVGNGGFGPEYGIIGIDSGMSIYGYTLRDNPKLLVEIKNYLREEVEKLQQDQNGSDANRMLYEATKREYETWNSKGNTFIMYGYGGCNTTTYVDCSKRTLPIYSVDQLDVQKHPRNTLRQWFYDWLDDKIKS